MPRRVTVRLFAQARLAVGRDRVESDVPEAGEPLSALLARLGEEYPRLRPVLAHCRFARNGAFLNGRGTRIRPGDDVAVHPPYSGG